MVVLALLVNHPLSWLRRYYVRLAPLRYPDIILTLSMRYASMGLIRVNWTEMVISQSLTNQVVIMLLTQGTFNVDCLAIHVDENIGGISLPTVSLEVKWTEEQRKDPVFATVCSLVSGGQKPTKEQRAQCDPEVLKFLNEWPRLILNQNALYRKRANTDGEENWQLLCPQQLRNVVCKLTHDDMGLSDRTGP